MEAATTTPAAAWADALGLLRRSMIGDSFSRLFAGSHVREAGDTWTIGVASETAKQWIEARHLRQVEQALAAALGEAPALQFVVAAPPATPLASPAIPGEAPVSPNPASGPGHPSPDSAVAADGLAALDYHDLWYNQATGGYDRMLKYWGEFWRAYLSRQNAVAYSLWEYLQIDDKRDIKSSDFTWWTPVRKHQVKPLARVLGCAPLTISGGFRQCSIFNAALAEGRELEECCRKYWPNLMNTTKNGNPQCVHWSPGAFETLYNEGLLAIRVTGDGGKGSFCHLQVWRLLPLLTPFQVEQLHEVERIRHEHWLNANEYKTGQSLATWQCEHRESAVRELGGHTTGRELLDRYQPNPLKPGYTGRSVTMVTENSEGDDLSVTMVTENENDDHFSITMVTENDPY